MSKTFELRACEHAVDCDNCRITQTPQLMRANFTDGVLTSWTCLPCSLQTAYVQPPPPPVPTAGPNPATASAVADGIALFFWRLFLLTVFGGACFGLSVVGLVLCGPGGVFLGFVPIAVWAVIQLNKHVVLPDRM